SCLRNRVRSLRTWAEKYYKKEVPPVLPENTPILTPEQRYDAVVKRLSLVIGDTPIEELATLNTVLETGYPFELTDDETDAVLTRAAVLEKLIETDMPQY